MEFVVHIHSVMFERLAQDGREFEDKTKEQMHEYADAGLRTLVLAYRQLDEEEYKSFNEKFMAAKNSVSADRDEKIEEAADSIERDLILLGATAVEDKLQNGVSWNLSGHDSCVFYGHFMYAFAYCFHFLGNG